MTLHGQHLIAGARSRAGSHAFHGVNASTQANLEPAYTEATPQENVVPRDAVIFTVRLPDNATLFVNGEETTSVGSTRQFISRRLVEGAHYAYTVRVEMPRGATPIVEERLVVATAGEHRQVTFGLDPREYQADHIAQNPDHAE